MIIKSVEFVKSSAKLSQCPETLQPEYAFVGRSNVGKSSLINMITQRKKLAMISGKPGKTRLINHYKINDAWYLVDLPGYGFAQVSKKEREQFEVMIKNYLENRKNLACLFLLIDIRHEPVLNDVQFINWLGEKMIPFVLVYTKSDKVSKEHPVITIESYKIKLAENWEEFPPYFITSAEKGFGRDEIIAFIEDTNKLLKVK